MNQLLATLGPQSQEADRLRAAAEERYRRLEAIIPGVVFTYRFRPDGHPAFDYANGAVRDLFHIEPEDLLRDGTLLADKIHPDDRERRDRAIQRSLETLEVFREELRHLVDGQLRWYDCLSCPVREPDGAVLGHGIILDITNRKLAEEALRQSEAKYRRLYESMMDGFAAADMEGRFIEVNRAFEKMLGYSAEELGNLTYRELAPEKWHPALTRVLHEQILPLGFSDVYENEYRRKDGSIVPVELRSFLMRDAAGHPSKIFSVVRDVSARKQAEAERAELEARLFEAQKMESVGRLAGGVAHDFNNMLTVIMGFTELAFEHVHPGDPVRNYLAEVRRAADHSKEITRQLLAFSRRQIVRKQPTDLNDLISSRQPSLSRIVGEDIDLNYFPGGEPLRVNVDAGQMEQILVNLALNARDAMPGGGTLTIQTRAVTIDETYRRLHPEFTPGGHVLLAVGDTGAGMDKETLSHCFEPFFTTKETGRGTGLGLATVYGIVRQNGGLVNVYSEPGQGTVFKIYLPAIDSESPQAATEREGPMLKGEGTILLVEDEDMVRNLAAEMLRSLGYSVLAAATPAEAWSMLQTGQRNIDLLLTDVMMPGMNGMQLRDRVLGVLPNVKVLFMSGFTSNDLLRRGVAEEHLSFLQKPFSLNELARAVRTALARDVS